MKAEITKDGKLAIIPESFTEDYALTAWLGSDRDQGADIQMYLESGPVHFQLLDCTDVMSSIHETAKDLHEAGLMSKDTMREFKEAFSDAKA